MQIHSINTWMNLLEYSYLFLMEEEIMYKNNTNELKSKQANWVG